VDVIVYVRYTYVRSFLHLQAVVGKRERERERVVVAWSGDGGVTV